MPGNFNRTRSSPQRIKKKFYRKFYVLLIFQLLFFCISVIAQRAKIDSLKKTLSSLKDSVRIDCLNTLSLVYSYLNADTAKSYAEKAYTEASAINYLRGKGMSLNNKAHIAGYKFHDFQQQEKISLQVIQTFKNLNDDHLLLEAYMNLALAFFFQSDFDRSSEACNTIVQLAKKTSNKKKLGEAIAVIGSINFESGNYQKSFENFNESLGIFKNINDSYNTAILLPKIGDLYRLAGDQKTALNFYFQSLEYPMGPSLQWHPLKDLGDTYYSLEQYDSTLYEQEKYLHTIKALTIRSNFPIVSRIRNAENYIASKEYDKALAILLEDLKTLRTTNDKNQVMRLLLDIGRAYEAKKDYTKAFYFATDLLQNARKHKAKQYIRDGSKLMWMVYDQLHRLDSAYAYYRLYIYMKDAVSLDEFSKKLAIYKAATENKKNQTQIESLNNQKIVSSQQLQISGQQLEKESLLRKILIGGVLLLILLGFIIFRNITLKRKNESHRHEIVEKELNLQKLESEKAKSELQQQAIELEMQVLRAQMNPHFIFNSLSSINHFVLKNETEIASDYLTKFSRLIRMVLNYSQRKLIALEDELKMLQLYLDLEKLRFKDSFEYKITCYNDLDAGAIFIPPLIFQPFAENAIWHGLMHKENHGQLDITISNEKNILNCIITDNGIGRKKAGEQKTNSGIEQKSMGLQITKQRLALLSQDLQNDNFYQINDLVDEKGNALGTKVTLRIWYRNSFEDRADNFESLQ